MERKSLVTQECLLMLPNGPQLSAGAFRDLDHDFFKAGRFQTLESTWVIRRDLGSLSAAYLPDSEGSVSGREGEMKTGNIQFV